MQRLCFSEIGVKGLWGRINVRKWPATGQPTKRVLLAHGFSDAVGCFSQVVKNLPEDWEIVGFDFPGHGDSDMPSNMFMPFDLGIFTIASVAKHLEWDKSRFHLVGHSMGGNISSAYNLLFPEQLDSLTLIDVPGIWCLNPEVSVSALKLCIMVDLEKQDFFYKRGQPKPWRKWIEIVRNTRNDQVEPGHNDEWFPTDEIAEEWLSHTMVKVGDDLWQPKAHPRIKLPYPFSDCSLSTDEYMHAASLVDTPVLRISCASQPKWKLDLLDIERNEKFWMKLSQNSRLSRHVAIEGTHMLTLTSPKTTANNIIDFIHCLP